MSAGPAPSSLFDGSSCDRLDAAARATPIPGAASVEGGHGLFGRLFPGLPPLVPLDADLDALARLMRDAGPNAPSGDNLAVPAGYTYLASFIEHDLTFDPMSLSSRRADPQMRVAYRAPALTLDSVYGAGPAGHAFLFRPDDARFVVGETTLSTDVAGNDLLPGLDDLPRTREGTALIPDLRNDSHLVVAQLHVAFLKFHNRVVDLLRGGGPGRRVFDEAVRLVRWHYQWMVLHDVLGRLLAPGTVRRVLADGPALYRADRPPYLPLEFSGAAWRFSAPMVREAYSYNRLFGPSHPRLGPASLDRFLRLTNVSGEISGNLPGGFSALPSQWVIDWRRWFELEGAAAADDVCVNPSRLIGPALAPCTHSLPGGSGHDASLAAALLRRGVLLGLPSGQDVAEAMRTSVPGVVPLSAEELGRGDSDHVVRSRGFHERTPLWFYLLKEAEVRAGGRHLGPIGSRIVAEVIVGLLRADTQSFLSERGWTPTLPSREAGTFRMADLLRLAGA